MRAGPQTLRSPPSRSASPRSATSPSAAGGVTLPPWRGAWFDLSPSQCCCPLPPHQVHTRRLGALRRPRRGAAPHPRGRLRLRGELGADGGGGGGGGCRRPAAGARFSAARRALARVGHFPLCSGGWAGRRCGRGGESARRGGGAAALVRARARPLPALRAAAARAQPLHIRASISLSLSPLSSLSSLLSLFALPPRPASSSARRGRHLSASRHRLLSSTSAGARSSRERARSPRRTRQRRAHLSSARAVPPPVCSPVCSPVWSSPEVWQCAPRSSSAPLAGWRRARGGPAQAVAQSGRAGRHSGAAGRARGCSPPAALPSRAAGGGGGAGGGEGRRRDGARRPLGAARRGQPSPSPCLARRRRGALGRLQARSGEITRQ